ncbi:unnamed protein product [Acanthoscelides obtectus]|uniref:Major facilitator superfamily (MFS) profile domain-containing protein n=2 Tax=Acanthoscelides obtectus TaxID=200917 RepID=A0A9P0LN58_ACAOB|nr:unnamed protein product [Acanthoscelides obtectus]CAK1640619.1 Synaptic vesicle glycoprotein 2B [Acanthoscelides obtectus]
MCILVQIVLDHGDKALEADFETAVQHAGYGKFQTILLAICGTVYATCAIGTTTLSFVLPSAECDFNLTSADKGKLSAVPVIGMIFGCPIWGSVANTKGRKTAILLSLLIDFLAAVISSVVTNFEVFSMCRFFNGFGIIGATSVVFSYLGEFLSEEHRDVFLGRLEIFWTIGIIILPGVAFPFLNKTVMDYFSTIDAFSSWRIFVLVCGLPSLISVIALYFLPESPKFLISKGKYDQARQVFQRMYECNTGNSKYSYPVLRLKGECDNSNVDMKFLKKRPLSIRIEENIEKLMGLIKVLFSLPYLKYLAISCFVDFGLMASYITMIMWFPEIFERFNAYEKYQTDSPELGVCVVSANKDTSTNIFEEFLKTFRKCDPSIDNRVFIETVIIGCSCIPTAVSLSYFMKKLGKNRVLVISLVLSGTATLLLNWVQNSTQTIILSCIFEALASLMEAVIFCVVVDSFPTNVRAIALAITATFGRLGAIFGNVIFGVLIDVNCVIPIYVFAGLQIASGILCLTMPQKENYIPLH